MFLFNQYLWRGEVRCIQCTTKNNKMSKLIQPLHNFLNSLCDILKFLSEPHEQLLRIGLGRLRGLPGNPRSSGRSMWDCHAIESDTTGHLGCYPLALSVLLSGIEIHIRGVDGADRGGVSSGIHFALPGAPISRRLGFLFDDHLSSAMTTCNI